MNQKTPSLFIVSILLLLGSLSPGCKDTATQQTLGPTPIAALGDPKAWKVSGELENTGAAVDGRIDTAATSAPSGLGASLTIDLGKTSLFNMVVIEHGPNPEGYARRVSVFTSVDGQKFTLLHTSPGTRRRTYLSVLTPVLARYVKLQAIIEEGRPWSVAEVYFQ